MAPTVVSHYRLLDRLGEGGMGVVYRAVDERLGREVAVKRLHADSPVDVEQRFAREAKLGAALNHPNLVTVFDTSTDDEGVLIVMEYVDGEPLSRILRRGPLRPEEAARIRPAVPRSSSHLSGVMLIRRAAFDRVGPWTEGLKVGTGVDWYMRSAEAGLKTTMLDHVFLERRIHSANNGLREADHRSQYLSIVKEALDRRRTGGG